MTQARLQAAFLASEGAESADAPKQTYVPLRLSMSESVPRKERAKKSRARQFRQYIKTANKKQTNAAPMHQIAQSLYLYRQNKPPPHPD